MKIDIGSFAYNFKNEVGGTPSWGTSVGQSQSHKITREGKESLALGMIYRSIDISKVTMAFGRGGNRTDENPIVSAALFDKVFVNGKRIDNAKFILLLTKQIGDGYVGQHFGRLTLKYPSSIGYDGNTYNEDIFEKINKVMGYQSDWTWFASDITIIAQDELHFRIHCFNEKVVFSDGNDKDARTSELMKNDGVLLPAEDNKKYRILNISPKASAQEYADYLKDLILRCGGSKWDAVRLFGALYHSHVDLPLYKKIRAILGLAESSDTEFKKGLNLGSLMISKDLIVEAEDVKTPTDKVEGDEGQSEKMPKRTPRTYTQYPLNLILYGAPGTGKTYSTMELASSIADGGADSIEDICAGATHKKEKMLWSTTMSSLKKASLLSQHSTRVTAMKISFRV